MKAGRGRTTALTLGATSRVVYVRIEVGLEGFAALHGQAVSLATGRAVFWGTHASIVAEEMMMRRSLRFLRILKGRKWIDRIRPRLKAP